MDDIHRYDEIINLPHHVSEKHPPLDKDSYAAQFLPFESLTGYDVVVEEAARTTDARVYIDDDEKTRLAAMLAKILRRKKEKPEVAVTYFVADKEKDGGEFTEIKGTVKRFDEIENRIIMDDGTLIPTDDVTDIKCNIED